MSVEERPLRADAERNRRRLLEAARTLFRERGLDVGVAEIAEAAGVGRGTLFRNFASKEDLIAAVVADQMHSTAASGETLLDDPDPCEGLFRFLAELIGRQQIDRAIVEAFDEAWLAREDIRAAHAAVVDMVERLLARAQDCGAIRPDVGAMDVLLMFKGVCAAATSYAHLDSEIINRQLDLMRAGIAVDPSDVPLRGSAPTLKDLERGWPPAKA